MSKSTSRIFLPSPSPHKKRKKKCCKLYWGMEKGSKHFLICQVYYVLFNSESNYTSKEIIRSFIKNFQQVPHTKSKIILYAGKIEIHNNNWWLLSKNFKVVHFVIITEDLTKSLKISCFVIFFREEGRGVRVHFNKGD